MYHYIPCTAGHRGGILYRDPADIREEMRSIRCLLQKTEERMHEAEEVKEEWLALSERDESSPEALLVLDAVVADCEEVKRTFEELWARTDGLSEELADTLTLLRGAVFGI